MKKRFLFVLPLVFLSQPAKAIEPISIAATLAGAVLSPVICKEIKCKQDNYIIVDRSKDKERLLEMRDAFHWEDLNINKNTASKEVDSLTNER